MLLTLLVAAIAPQMNEVIKSEVARGECAARDGTGEVVVCGPRRKTRRFRVTEPTDTLDYKMSRPSVMRERSKWIEEGDTGTGSCSSVGPGGWTGCMQKGWKRARQQVKGWYG